MCAIHIIVIIHSTALAKLKRHGERFIANYGLLDRGNPGRSWLLKYAEHLKQAKHSEEAQPRFQGLSSPSFPGAGQDQTRVSDSFSRGRKEERPWERG